MVDSERSAKLECQSNTRSITSSESQCVAYNDADTNPIAIKFAIALPDAITDSRSFHSNQ